MSKKCIITKKKTIFGNNRSHSLNATKRKFYPNLQYHRFWIPTQKRFIRIKVSTNGIRCINKNGIEYYLKKIGK